jgi:hypothetical protein
MAGKHRAPRPCWRVRVHSVAVHASHYGHQIVGLVTLHVVSVATYEASIRHALSNVTNVGH